MELYIISAKLKLKQVGHTQLNRSVTELIS
ncbi:hypothetical protein Bhyg_13611 [Pseudolycoriella hygida]|uniref:Uncharacterized protein n=1 Tax=Pseudolycoriella hygida TaxID=35572 RepID=A0A9Q0MQG5_9DIPT|nr:hypothetical protein Bhyg_13611 [Pseudolycoriella hygida]